jgi:hypothetical protein
MYAMNWRPIIYTSFLIATKYWEDRYFWNVDVVEKLKLFNLSDTNRYENLFVAILEFRFYVPIETVQEYFKHLMLYQHFLKT